MLKCENYAYIHINIILILCIYVESFASCLCFCMFQIIMIVLFKYSYSTPFISIVTACFLKTIIHCVLSLLISFYEYYFLVAGGVSFIEQQQEPSETYKRIHTTSRTNREATCSHFNS